MRVLLIDDIRLASYVASTWGIDVTDVAKTFKEGIERLKEGNWDLLCLDHDLGEESPHNTGYGIMQFLEANPHYLPKEIFLVTSNPVGRQNMQRVIDKLYKSEF